MKPEPAAVSVRRVAPVDGPPRTFGAPAATPPPLGLGPESLSPPSDILSQMMSTNLVQGKRCFMIRILVRKPISTICLPTSTTIINKLQSTSIQIEFQPFKEAFGETSFRKSYSAFFITLK